MRVKCLAQDQTGLKPGLLDLVSSTLTMRPPCLPHQNVPGINSQERTLHMKHLNYPWLLDPFPTSIVLLGITVNCCYRGDTLESAIARYEIKSALNNCNK